MQSKNPKTTPKPARSRRRRKRLARRNAWRVALSVMTVIALVLIGALCAGYAAFRGPSPTMGDLLTVSLLETSALKFVPRIYYSQAEVDAIVERNSVGGDEEETDTSMIVISRPTPVPAEPVVTPQPEAQDAADIVVNVTPSPTPAPENLISSEDGIEIYAVKGATYTGFMMVVDDPSRVACGTSRDKFDGASGLQLKEIAQRYDAVAAINGGGFEDSGGMGNGSVPIGVVISNGQLMHGGNGGKYNVTVGFNQDDIMIIGEMTEDEALAKGLRDAMTFGPALVINGEAVSVKGLSSGLNPRTAIGQRADGAVLMLVIDGRQASSLGASYADLITQMLQYGAVNAINLDGGSSSLMYYKGDYMNRGVVLTGSRDMPTAFIVR
ncbi:MAG: phosphodiester glycosidase family protein [Clostridia bacterium]|nr:phosphodiester glycosidase family protein [Clostridia bacterium]